MSKCHRPPEIIVQLYHNNIMATVYIAARQWFTYIGDGSGGGGGQGEHMPHSKKEGHRGNRLLQTITIAILVNTSSLNNIHIILDELTCRNTGMSQLL